MKAPPTRTNTRSRLMANAGAAALAGLIMAGEAHAGGSLPAATNPGAWSGVSTPPTTTSTSETVTVTSSRAYAEWSSFNLGAGNSFNVAGQSANWILVNRVTGGTGSSISGSVSANGQVWIIDPNGVTVNAGAVLNVGGLLLSSASWSSTDRSNFLSGGTSWSFTGQTSPIVMNGTVNAQGGGVVALLAPSVSVGGTIVGGSNTQVVAVAAKDVSLDFTDNGTYFVLDGVSIGRGADGGQVAVSSGASISADRIVIAAAGETSAANIVVSGSLVANAARGDGTDIVLMAANGTGPDAAPVSQTVLSGGSAASWIAGATQGGITLSSGSSLSASGMTLDGPVSLGGDTTLTGSASFASTVQGTGALNVTGDASFSGSVSTASLSVGGTTALNGGSVSTTEAQTYAGAVTLGADATLGGSAVGFGSTVDGGHGLTVNASGAAQFGGAVGGGSALAGLQVTAGSISLGGGVQTTGALSLASQSSLTVHSALTSNGGAISLAANGGGLVLGASVNAGDGTLALSASGTIDQTAGAITAGTLTASSVGGMSLANANHVTHITSLANTVSGDLVVYDAQNLGLGNVSGAGSVKVSSAGYINDGSGTVSAGKDLVLAAATNLFIITAPQVGRDYTATATSFYGRSLAPVFGAGGLDFTIDALGPLTTRYPISAPRNLTIETKSDLTLAYSVSAGATLDLSSGGAINQTYGTINAPTLTGSAATSATLNDANAVGTLSGFTAPQGLSFVNATGFTASGVQGGTSVSLTANTGDLTLSGNVSGAATSLTATTGAINQTGGVITATMLSGSAGTSATLGQANVVGTLSGFTATTGLSFVNATGFTASGVQGGTSVSLTASTGDLTLSGDVGASTVALAATTGAINQTGGTITAGTLSGSAGTSATLGQANAVGTLFNFTATTGLTFADGAGFSASGVQGGTSTSLTANTGDMVLSGNVSGTATTLTASTGAISQTGGAITAATLSGSAGTGVALNQANAVGSLSNFTATAGLQFTNATGFSAAGVAGGTSVSLTASTGDLTLTGNVSGTATTLTATTGAIDQTGGVITAATLSGTAATSATLGQSNTVGTFSNFTATTGLTFVDGSGFTAGGVNGGSSTSLTASTGQLTLAGNIGGTALTLAATAGQISQTGGVVTTGTLTAMSVGGASLAQANHIGTIQSFTNTLSGDLVVADAQDLAIGKVAGAASVRISSTGSITQSGGGITAGQDLVLTAATNLDLAQAPSVGRDYSVTAASFSGLALAPTFTSGRDFTIDALGALSLPYAISAPRNLTIETRGDLTLAYSVSAGATLDLSSGGAINQTGGTITAPTLTGSAATSVALDQSNAVGILTGFTATSGLSFVNATGFTASGVQGGTSTSLTASTGDLTLTGNLAGASTTLTATTGAINQTGGVITATMLSGSAGTSATLDQANAVGTLTGFTATNGLSFVNATGFTASGVQGGTSVSLTAKTGDLTLSGDIGGGFVALTASSGAITQTSGVITAETVTGSAATSVMLTDANKVAALAGFTAANGLIFVNATGFSASGIDGGTSTSLTASAGDLALAGNVAGISTTLTATLGAINQTGGAITAGTLTGSAGTSATLGQSNAVGTLASFTASQGLSFVNATGFTASGVQGGTSVGLTANTGDLTLSGNVAGTATTLTATVGAITQTGGVITASTLSGSAGTSATLNGANAVGTLSGFTATTGLQFVNAAGFTVAGVDGGASTSLTASTGDLMLAGNIGGGTTTLTATTGAITQTGGAVTADTLTGSAGTSATLGQANSVGTLSDFTASQGLTFVNATGFSASVVQGGTSTSLTANSGDLTLSGNVSGSATSLTALTGSITQTGGALTASTLTGSAATSASLNGANGVGTLSNFTATTGLSFTNATGFSAAGVQGGTSASLTASTGDLTLAGDVGATSVTLTATTGAINQTGGVITGSTLSGSAGTSAALNDANAVGTLSGFTATTGLTFVNAAGFTATGVDGGTSTSLTASTGDLTLSGNIGGGTTTLTATTGAITQTGGVITADTLTGSAATSASLPDANAVGALMGFTAPAGIVFVNGVGFSAAGVDGGTSTSLTANTGDLTLAGNVNGSITSLTTLTGSITQTGGVVTADTLTGSAGAGATLTDENKVQTLTGFTATTGLAFTDAGGFSAANVNGGASTSLTASSGQLTLAGDITGTSVALIAAAGPILQTGGVVTAGTLTGSSVGPTTLAGANLIDTLGVFTTYGPGADFMLTNAQTLTVTGPVTAGATAPGGAAGVAEGNLYLTTTAGALNLDGDLIANADASGTGGGVALAAYGSITTGDPPAIHGQLIGVSTQTGSIALGDLTAKQDIAISSPTGSISIDSVVAGGNIVLRAPGDITIAGALTTTGTATGSGSGQALFASNPTTLAGVAFDLSGSNVDLKAGGSISVGGPTTAATDARFQAGGSVSVSDVTAGRDIYLDAAGAATQAGQATVSAGALVATGRDIAVLAENGGVAIGSASAGDDVAIRAAGSVTATGGLTAGSSGGAEAAGVADQLIGASPATPITFAGTTYSSVAGGADVDVKAGWTPTGVESAGASITVGGATSAGRDARFQSTGAISLGAVTAGQDVVADGASLGAGALTATSGDVTLQATGGVQIASASAGDAIVVNSGGVFTAGALTAMGSGTGDSRLRAGDALAGSVLGLGPGLTTGDVVIVATNVQLSGSVSAANGEVLMFARPSGSAAGTTYLGGTDASDAQGDFHLDQAEIGGITAKSLSIFAGLTAAGSGDVSIGSLNLPSSLPSLRIYAGGATSRVDVFGPVTGPGASLVIGDTQLRSEMNAPSAAVLALSQGWTPNVIRVEGTIGGLGKGQAFGQVSLSAENIYIAPVETGLDFETAVKTTRPENLAVYKGKMTYQIAAANLQLSSTGPGVIYERNLALDSTNLAAGVGLSVGKITIDTVTPGGAPPSQIALFGTLSPNGVALNGLDAALSLTYSSQLGAGAPVRFTPPPATFDLYKFSTCAFGGGACFVNVPPYSVSPVPVTNQIGDLTDPYSPQDEEPVTSSGGEVTWPSVADQGPHQ
jgi:filamentous hemagglutinin family protein